MELGKPPNKVLQAIAIAISLCCLLLDHAQEVLLSSSLVRVAGWVFLLPNHTYLYFFAWMPLVCLTIWLFMGKRLSPVPTRLIAAILLIGAIAYLAVGVALLVRTFPYVFIAFWIVPVFMSVLYLRTGIYLIRHSGKPPISARQSILIFTLVTALLLAMSTIFVQPWTLVVHLPDVRGASFRNINLKGLRFGQVEFTDTDFTNANFEGASFHTVKFANVAMDAASFAGAYLENVTMVDVTLSNANFDDSWIFQSEISKSSLENATFQRAFTSRSYLNEVRLCGASFNQLEGQVYGWRGSIYGPTTTLPADVNPQAQDLIFDPTC